MVSEKTIRERVIEIAADVLNTEFAAICAADGMGAAYAERADGARASIRRVLDSLGDCRSFEKMTDAGIRASLKPELRKLVREALATRRPS